MIDKIELLQSDVEEIVVYSGYDLMEANCAHQKLIANKIYNHNGKQYYLIRIEVINTESKLFTVSFIGRLI